MVEPQIWTRCPETHEHCFAAHSCREMARETLAVGIERVVGWPQECPTCKGDPPARYHCDDCQGEGVAWGPIRQQTIDALTLAAEDAPSDLLGGGCDCEDCKDTAEHLADAVLAAIGGTP